MFTQLLASRPARQQSTPQMMSSIALHGFIVTALWASFNPTPKAIDRPLQQTTVYIPPTVELPRPAPTVPQPPTQPTPATPSLPQLFNLAPVSPGLPTVAPSSPIDFIGTRPSLPGGLSTPPLGPAAGTTFMAEQVEVVAALEKGSPVPRFPSSMRFAGMDGTARFQFVVDTTGRVDLSSVREIQSSHTEFALAVRSTLPHMRFLPAQVGGRPVRQLVEFPIVFRLGR